MHGRFVCTIKPVIAPDLKTAIVLVSEQLDAGDELDRAQLELQGFRNASEIEPGDRFDVEITWRRIVPQDLATVAPAIVVESADAQPSDPSSSSSSSATAAAAAAAATVKP